MESGLLNAFHDDHYDGNYSTFVETEPNYWSHGTDSLGLQLTEALEGILPLSPEEEKPIFENDLNCKYSFHLEDSYSEQNNCITTDIWKNDGLQMRIVENDEKYQSRSPSPTIEIIPVDPNYDYNSPFTISDADDDDDDEEDDDDDDDENVDQHSRRTISSSIADYESYDSDECDLEYEKIEEENHQLFHGNIKEEIIQIGETEINDLPFMDSISNEEIEQQKSPTKGNNKLNDLNSFETDIITMKNFDLASFITQDDDDYGYIENIKTSSNTTITTNEEKIIAKNILENTVQKSKNDPEEDDDIIVDVETVETAVQLESDNLLNNNNNDLQSLKDNDLNNSNLTMQIEDDPAKDPSWSPKLLTTKTIQKFQKNKIRNACKSTSNQTNNNNKTYSVNKLKSIMANKLPPQLSQSCKNVGVGRGKNISMSSKPENADTGEENDKEKCYLKDKPPENVITNCLNKTQNDTMKKTIPIVKLPQKLVPKRAIEVEIQGNKIVEVQKKDVISPKLKNQNISSNLENQSKNVSSRNEDSMFNKPQEEEKIEINSDTCDNNALPKTAPQQVIAQPPKKKKLNLEEYKKLRGKNILYIQKCPSDSRNNIGISCQSKLNQIELYEPKKAEDVLILPCQPVNSIPKPIVVNIKEEPTDEKQQKQQNNQKVQSIQKTNKQFYDPIIEAKNKVLRLQELKKAAQTKLIDSTVSSKVGPITKILPLEEIVKISNNNKVENRRTFILNPEYEEIIIVSAGCNTEITLAPFEKIEDLIKKGKTSGSLLVKSTALLYNINNTLQKVKSSENIKISSNSLISSIQDVVLKKSTPTVVETKLQAITNSPEITVQSTDHVSPIKSELSQIESVNNNSSIIPNKQQQQQQNNQDEHGEDKIIMHLRKDRIRPKMQTISIQTDPVPQFPELSLIISSKSSNTKMQCYSKKERSRRKQYRSHRDTYSSDENECDQSFTGRNHAYPISSRNSPKSRSRKHSYRSRSRSHSRSDHSPASLERRQYEKKNRKRKYSSSCSESNYSGSSSSDSKNRSSRSRSRSYSSSRSRSSDSSTSHSRSQSMSGSRRKNISRSNIRRNASPAVEERRIVYVGRIEQDTTKEDLKRKFLSYGPIRQVTIHYKDTGMKYGFVTFEKAQDAFNAIDNGTRDAKINMYDISFGGRRAFCQATYSDLDGAATNSLQVRSYTSSIVKKPPAEGSFEDLLKEVKQRIRGVKGGGSCSRF